VSLAKFDPAGRRGHLVKALLYPVLLHGTYDALLMVSTNLEGSESMLATGVTVVLFVAFVIFDVRLWRRGLKRIKRMQERTKEQDCDRSRPFEGFTWYV
jgi:membrane protein implicated in regulation of membrane protease activity